MQSEFTASAVAWGFSTFSKNKCSVKAITSPNVTAETVYRIEKEKKDDADEQIIISRGTLFEIGLEFSPNSSFVGSLDEFIASFEKHKQLLNFNLQVQLGCGQAVHRETSDIQKRANQHGDPDKMNCTVFCQRPNGFYIGTRTSIQLPFEYVDVPIQLQLSASLIIPESSCPSNHRSDMSSEELSLRALLEGGRYRVPKIDPLCLSVPAVVILTLRAACWAEKLGPCSALLGVELTNTHPHRDLQIHSVEVNLPATLSIYESHVPEEETFLAPSHPPVHHWLASVPLPAHSAEACVESWPITISSGESHTVVFKVAAKDFCQGPLSPTPASRGAMEQFVQSLQGFPPASLSGHFVSPVDIHWCPLLASPSASSPPSSKSESPLSMHLAAPVYWQLEKRGGSEFFVSISGPDTAECFLPVSLQVLITNRTAQRRDLVVYLQPPPLLSSSELQDGSGEQCLNHDVSLSAGEVSPGGSVSLSAVVHPLQRGPVHYCSIHLLDLASGEVFCAPCAFSMLVQ